MNGASPVRPPLKILVVDDDGFVRDLLAEILASHDHRVELAESGESAMTRMEAAADFDLIISDINMPGMGGLELLRHVRRSDPDTPIIILTGNHEVRLAIDAMQHGANDYLLKDEDVEDALVISIDRVMETHRLKAENARLIEDLAQKNRFIRETFGRYLSENVVTGLLDLPGGLQLGGEKRLVTIMMTDLRGFSALAEGLDPQHVVSLLNCYLEVMTGIIVKWGGTIDEFIGDAILVLFGAPVLRPDDHIRAAACALEMQREMKAVNAMNREKALPEIEMGIGIHTGEAVVGNIGSKQRAKYGVVGRSVNFASRIESFTVGGQILISESLRTALGPLAELGTDLDVQPKGMRSVVLHDLIGLGGDIGIRLERRVCQLEALPAGMPCRFIIVEGKDARGTERDGSIVALSGDIVEAEVKAEEGVRPFANLRLVLGELPGAEVYAKVVAGHARVGTFIVRFTSVPDPARRVLTAAFA